MLCHVKTMTVFAALGLATAFGHAADTAPPAAPNASAPAPTSSGAPQAKAATNLRSVHYRRRDQCEHAAAAQGLAPEEHKVFVYKCLQQM